MRLLPSRAAIESFREGCKLNAPLIDFVSKVVLAILGLVLAFFAMQLTRTQIEIQQGLLQIQLQAHLPKFSLRVDPPTKQRQSSLVVDNEGGYVFDFAPDVVVFWRVYEHDRRTHQLVASANIAAEPFFIFGIGPWSRWSPPTGELARYYISYLENWKEWTMGLNRLPTPSTWIVGDDYEFVVRVRYKDVFGAKHEQFYAITVDAREHGSAISPTQLLTSDDGSRLFKVHESQVVERGRSPSKFTAQEAWNKYRTPAD